MIIKQVVGTPVTVNSSLIQVSALGLKLKTVGFILLNLYR